jgi:hypothetical protein
MGAAHATFGSFFHFPCAKHDQKAALLRLAYAVAIVATTQ